MEFQVKQTMVSDVNVVSSPLAADFTILCKLIFTHDVINTYKYIYY